MITFLLRLSLLASLLLGGAASFAQQWNYAYLAPQGMLSTKAELERASDGSYKLHIYFPNPDYCFRSSLPSQVEVKGNLLIISPQTPFKDCIEFRLLVRTDGQGGTREFRRPDGKWGRESMDRDLKAIGAPAAWFTALLGSSPAQASQAVAQQRPAPVREPNPTERLESELKELRAQLQAARTPVVTAAAAPVTPPAQKSATAPRLKVRALVVGNSAYSSFGKLPNPRNDAQAMAEKFRAMGIQVDLLLDADRDTFVKALNDFSLRAVGHDVNILYYAGHGVQVEGTNYLVPINMRADGISAGYIKLSAISLNAVLDYMPGSTRLVFLDACRDNPASRSLVATRGGAAVGLAPVSAGSGTLIAYATKDGATAEDGQGRHSPYTAALLEHLDRPEDIAVVLRRVRQSVMRATSNRQEPWEYGSLVGEQLVLSQVAR